jgi:hypothetical protein
VEGATLRGGTLNINNNFIVDEDGNVTMNNADINNYIKSDEFADVTGKMMWRTEVVADGPTVFTDKNQTAKLTCRVYSWDEDKTNTIGASQFKWIRSSANASSDEIWNSNHVGMKSVVITHEDMMNNATFYCQVNIE